LLQVSFGLNAQVNLVPNPSFEEFTQCPNSSNELYKCKNWFRAASSPDYYNSCSGQGNMGVPYNIYGFQYAADGNAYVGMVTYGLNDNSYWQTREIIGCKLNSQMEIGIKYFIKFKASFTLNDFETGIAVNKLGVLFSNTQHSYIDSGSTPPINNFAHFFTDSIIQDTLNWVTIFGSFVSDDNYEYMYIGNFFENSQTDRLILIDDSLQNPASYYYIDDIVVSTDSIFVLRQKPNISIKNVSVFINSNNELVLLNLNPNINYSILIYNINGKLIYESYNIKNYNTIKLPLDNFNDNILLLKLLDSKNNSIFNYKLNKL
jgi:hypothetical protein